MDYKKLNEVLSDLNALRRTSCHESKTHDYDYDNDGSLGYEIYHFEGDVYIKLIIRLDSYGDNEQIVGVEFVSPQVVKVTNFEPIK